MIVLHKPSKSTYRSISAYRPISLLSNIVKIMESIIHRRIVRYIESRGAFSPFQFGFRTGREAINACDHLAHDVIGTFRQWCQVQAIFLDIKSAHPSVWIEGMRLKIQTIDFP